MHYSVRMPSRKSPQIGVSLNERLLKHFYNFIDTTLAFTGFSPSLYSFPYNNVRTCYTRTDAYFLLFLKEKSPCIK